MKFLLDQLPLIVFFAAYFGAADRAQALFLATALGLAAAAVQVSVHRLVYRRFDRAQLITLAVFAVLGGLTLALHDRRFILWKPTVVYWLFAAVFLASEFLGERNLAQRLMGHAVAAPAAAWRRVNASWVAFFVLMGIANLYVAFHFPEALWVKYKVVGAMAIFLLFAVAQAVYLARLAQAGAKEGL